MIERRARPTREGDPDNYRLFVVMRNMCYLGAPSHAAFAPLFVALGVPLLGYFNIFSAIAWVFALWLTNNGRYRLAIDLLTLEVIGFSAIGVYCLGWGAGFQTYLMPLIAFVMVNYRLGKRTVLLQGITLVALYTGLYRYTVGREFTAVSPRTMEWLHYMNIAIVFSAICIIAYYFREASLTAERKMERLATTDNLTGIANRLSMWSHLEREWLRSDDTGRPTTVLIADVDHFKAVNDVHGHDIGDAALKHVAACLQKSVREGDRVGRWGGEEFLAVLPETGLDAGRVVGERVRATLAAERFVVSGIQFPITMTIGVAERGAGEPLDRCIKRADQALYLGKQSGRDRVQPAESPA
ncbi:MAG: diguanylate cyclase [Thermoanaerobaculia bacterium]|nr:diguanylate cyclase [Thermoanaerobaculia bacterium]